jgi:outer membrane cobalamin receptor
MSCATCLRSLCLVVGLASCIRADTRMQSSVDPKVSGRFFNREDIRVSGRTSLADLLRTIPGAAVTHRSDGGVQVLFARCRGKMPPRANGSQVETGTQLFINGMKVQDAAAEVRALRLSDIEAIEVYRAPSELPADARGDGCAAIFVRTRAIQ